MPYWPHLVARSLAPECYIPSFTVVFASGVSERDVRDAGSGKPRRGEAAEIRTESCTLSISETERCPISLETSRSHFVIVTRSGHSVRRLHSKPALADLAWYSRGISRKLQAPFRAESARLLTATLEHITTNTLDARSPRRLGYSVSNSSRQLDRTQRSPHVLLRGVSRFLTERLFTQGSASRPSGRQHRLVAQRYVHRFPVNAINLAVAMRTVPSRVSSQFGTLRF